MSFNTEDIKELMDRTRQQAERAEEIDLEAMQKAKEDAEKKRNDAFSDYKQRLTAQEKQRSDFIGNLFKKMQEKEDKRRQREMEMKIKEETAAAEAAIKKKYEKEGPAEWNEDESRKEFRQLARTLLNK